MAWSADGRRVVTPLFVRCHRPCHTLGVHHIPQRAIDGKRPIQALKKWQQEKPDLFVKRVDDQTGLDRYRTGNIPGTKQLSPAFAKPANRLLCF